MGTFCYDMWIICWVLLCKKDNSKRPVEAGTSCTASWNVLPVLFGSFPTTSSSSFRWSLNNFSQRTPTLLLWERGQRFSIQSKNLRAKLEEIFVSGFDEKVSVVWSAAFGIDLRLELFSWILSVRQKQVLFLGICQRNFIDTTRWM